MPTFEWASRSRGLTEEGAIELSLKELQAKGFVEFIKAADPTTYDSAKDQAACGLGIIKSVLSEITRTGGGYGGSLTEYSESSIAHNATAKARAVAVESSLPVIIGICAREGTYATSTTASGVNIRAGVKACGGEVEDIVCTDAEPEVSGGQHHGFNSIALYA
jgi:hypothetical protein